MSEATAVTPGGAKVSGARVEPAVVAVVGTGSIGTRHLEVLAGLGGVTPVAVPVRAERVAELSTSGQRAVARLEESGARAAIIATDTSRHLEDALAALRLGCDVLVEKPMAVDAAQARQMRDEARRLGRQLFIGCVLRFSESLNRFRLLLPELGRVHSVEIACQSYLPDWRPGSDYRRRYSARAAEGGVLRDLIHEVDYAGWLFGWPEAVFARLRNLGRLGIEAEELAEMSWELPAGGAVSVTLDYLTRPPRRLMRACGQGGTLEWDGREGTVTCSRAEGSSQPWRATQTKPEMFAAQAQAFLAARASRPDFRLATADHGALALAVCDAARRSSETRREELIACA